MVNRAPELIVALDVPTLDQALVLRQELDEVVGFFKIGKELFTAAGPEILRRLSPSRIFLDLKFHDIPQTVFGAVAAAARHGVDLLDVHASGGEAMMRAAAEAARSAVDTASWSRPLLFGVTVLTHLGDEDLASIGIRDSSRDQVMRLAGLAAKSGLDGVVASAWEVEPIRETLGDRLQILVPGVRPDGSGAAHDQKRVATPREAARVGASYIVVGRAVSRAPSPREAAKRILEELSEP